MIPRFFFSFLYKTVEGISFSLRPLLCTYYTLNNVKWKLRNFSSVLSLPNETQVGAKYENKTHANDPHFSQLFLRSFFLPPILAGSFLSRQKKIEKKNKPKKLTEHQHFSLVSFHFSITLLRLRWTAGHTPRVRLGMCYGSLTARSDATNGNVSSSSRSFAD